MHVCSQTLRLINAKIINILILRLLFSPRYRRIGFSVRFAFWMFGRRVRCYWFSSACAFFALFQSEAPNMFPSCLDRRRIWRIWLAFAVGVGVLNLTWFLELIGVANQDCWIWVLVVTGVVHWKIDFVVFYCLMVSASLVRWLISIVAVCYLRLAREHTLGMPDYIGTLRVLILPWLLTRLVGIILGPCMKWLIRQITFIRILITLWKLNDHSLPREVLLL